MENTRGLLKYWRRDALAGSVTGIVAVPLTVGICLMSEYPVQVGIQTVLLACVVGFISSLFRPGNYVGVPGVAAGLAPALALGVTTFGIENMPFLIFCTALLQAFVWRYRLEGYIMKTVPSYLVEGVLAGVGLKIALKFLPFTYFVGGSGEFGVAELQMLGVSAIVMIGFLALYRRYGANNPGLPYVVLLVLGTVAAVTSDVPLLAIESSPIRLMLPLPHFDMAALTPLFMLKLIFFPVMLATIDIIEQVMSNVAIEKVDPLGRKCDTNNSLFAIWIANLLASFFGGMTNLDGLAKGNTNRLAGAMTKLSNVFVALVLLVVMIFPQATLGLMPQFVLGIIMLFTSWKMIAGLSHVKALGAYPLVTATASALLVYKIGIFEGLLLVLAIHASIQTAKRKRNGHTWRDIRLLILAKYQRSTEGSA